MDNELMMKIESMHGEIKEAEEKIKIVDQQIEELKAFEETLEQIEKNKNKEILTPLGKGVFAKADMKNEKLFLEVGAGILVRKDIKEAKEIISDQNTRLNQIRMQVATEYEMLYNQIQETISRLESVGE